MNGTRLAAFSVDLDEIAEYYAIHGLGEAPQSCARAVYELALPRLMEFATELDLPLTLFVIGRDLAVPGSAVALQRFVKRGDELGNHTLDHAYDVSRWSRGPRRCQIQVAATIIRDATGYQPVGFRAPGYTLSDGLVQDLADLGYRYDSSVFSCPSYYGAKALVMAAQVVSGRQSKAILGSPSVFLAPTSPYQTGERYYQRGNGIVEIPITLTRRLRLPVIGTTLGMLAGGRFKRRVTRWLTQGLSSYDVINLELHGIDFLDAADGLSALKSLQPGLAAPWRRKLEVYGDLVEDLRRRGYRWVTLREVACAAVR